jgi:hypothetical protein
MNINQWNSENNALDYTGTSIYYILKKNWYQFEARVGFETWLMIVMSKYVSVSFRNFDLDFESLQEV